MRHDLFRFSGNHVPYAAILLSRSRYGTHTAIIYRDDQRRLRRLDFYLEGQIASSEWKGDEFHVIPNVDDDDALANLAALCQVVAKRYDLKPPEHLFGFRRSPQAHIDARTGELYLGDAAGTSCAAFVLIVLTSARIELVAQGDDWPHRPESDDLRHSQLVELLRRRGTSQNDIDRVCAELPCPRVAPEEVAGAGMFPGLPDRPADQVFAQNAARWIIALKDLNSQHNV
jgi:hypothetical protein